MDLRAGSFEVDSGASVSYLDEDLFPWQGHEITIEAGMLWKIGSSTPIAYELLPVMTTVKIPYTFYRDWDEKGHLVARTRFSLLTQAVLEGPESYLLGFSGGPSFEWWNEDLTLSHFFSVGGGLAMLDSTNVVGGHSQDFNFNWYVHMGTRHTIREGFYFQYGLYFQHTSNTGLKMPNPGLNALGPMVGFSWDF